MQIKSNHNKKYIGYYDHVTDHAQFCEKSFEQKFSLVTDRNLDKFISCQGLLERP